jgi:hypothetical protein
MANHRYFAGRILRRSVPASFSLIDASQQRNKKARRVAGPLNNVAETGMPKLGGFFLDD